ncbi:uncharacterized protein LOC113225509 [Hyposmocoma kahamanoa]|uniref:uncharacterized protein LOC113225509 n=1 Tax=Hyposmocoma kahamanoa TaxID=1477025 RepID=UPI000E6D8A75|nr:uncharacterized protein LOC113225509 [Hyposmocoma kahamanoa]
MTWKANPRMIKCTTGIVNCGRTECNMSTKLHYFHVNGLGEPIRYILHYAGEKFEDVRYDPKSWPIKNVKDTLPFGQLPLYEEGNRTLNQSLAIARYLASKTNLLPSDPWEQALLDAVVFNIYDFWSKVTVYIKEQDPVKKQAIRKEILDESVEFFLSRFERELKKNNGYFGRKLTWADFVFVGIIEAANLFLDTEIEKKYPTIQTLVQKIRNLPGVKEYIATRKPYSVMIIYSTAIVDSELVSDCKMSKKLYYFNRNGLAEFTRYILHYSGEKFEDIRYDRKKWPIKDVKDKLPYGQVPIYQEGDRTLNQSIAIARYVASKTGLLPSDPWDQAVLDAIVFTLYDFWSTKVLAFIKEQDPMKKHAIKKEIEDEAVDFYFSRFEKELKKNNGHFAGRLTWADFVLVGMVEAANFYLSIEVEKNYPTIQNLVQKITNLPGVKEYIATREPYSL